MAMGWRGKQNQDFRDDMLVSLDVSEDIPYNLDLEM